MTTFYFIRHGKTELNVQLKFQGGEIDSPLLGQSIDQATQTGKYLSDCKFDFVAISTQKRAIDTANYILGENKYLAGLTTRYYDELREINFGIREGTNIDDLDEQTTYLKYQPHLYNPTYFHGETIDHLVLRGKKVIEEMSQMYPEGTILVVSHGVLLITLINALVGKEKKYFREGGPLENTSVTIVQKSIPNNQYTIKKFNAIHYQ